MMKYILAILAGAMVAGILRAQPQPPITPPAWMGPGPWVWIGPGQWMLKPQYPNYTPDAGSRVVKSDNSSALARLEAAVAVRNAKLSPTECGCSYCGICRCGEHCACDSVVTISKVKRCGCGGDPIYCTCGEDCDCCDVAWEQQSSDYWIAYRRGVPVGAYHRSWNGSDPSYNGPRRWKKGGGDEPWNVPLPPGAAARLQVAVPVAGAVCRT